MEEAEGKNPLKSGGKRPKTPKFSFVFFIPIWYDKTMQKEKGSGPFRKNPGDFGKDSVSISAPYLRERMENMDYMAWIWLAVIVLAVTIEAVSPQLVSIWFAVGALASLVASMLVWPLWVQLLLFVGITLLSVLLTRPLVKKRLDTRTVQTNSDRYVGMQGIVLQTIDNTQGVGQVKVQGSIWTARSEQADRKIPENAVVTVVRIEDAKLIVRL